MLIQVLSVAFIGITYKKHFSKVFEQTQNLFCSKG